MSSIGLCVSLDLAFAILSDFPRPEPEHGVSCQTALGPPLSYMLPSYTVGVLRQYYSHHRLVSGIEHPRSDV